MASTMYEALGQRISKRRKSLGLTQEMLGERADISRASVASIEAGRQRISLDQLYDLASALELETLADIVALEVGSRTTVAPIESSTRLSRVQNAQIDGLLRAALKARR
jgi:transcriptional regulator with XRE-family HTH domain